MSSTKNYDVAIIGSGPGGYVAAIRAAQLGLSVLIVERESRLGGVCTLRGCIPTKALLHTADLLEQARHGADVGVAAKEVRLDLPGAMKHKEKVVRQSSNGVAYLMKKNRVDVVNGFGRIAGVGKVSVAGADGAETSYAARNIIVATGSAPRSLPGIEIDHKTVLSSDSILELAEVPEVAPRDRLGRRRGRVRVDVRAVRLQGDDPRGPARGSFRSRTRTSRGSSPPPSSGRE